MKFYCISGSENPNETVKKDVEKIVKSIIEKWDWIVTWWSLWVDYHATEIAISLGDPKKQLKIFLPTSLGKVYENHNKRVIKWDITQEQADMITSQLRKVLDMAPESIYDKTPYVEVNGESYSARTVAMITECDELYAFQVNNGKWTQNAIDNATELWKPTTVKKYTID